MQMWKLAISAVSLEIIDFILTEIFIVSLSTFHKSFAKITEIDWLLGQHKWLFIDKVHCGHTTTAIWDPLPTPML